jgi:Protein of unknown function (DUF3011)
VRSTCICIAVFVGVLFCGLISPVVVSAEEGIFPERPTLPPEFSANDEMRLARNPQRYEQHERRHYEPEEYNRPRRSSGEQKRIRCESEGGRHEYCETGPGYVRLDRQLSRTPCVEYDTWGTEGNGVWVRDGCRATFVVEERSPGIVGGGYGWWGNKSVVCKSEGFQYNQCPLDRRGRQVRLVRQLSDTRCVRGDNWGANRDGLWVDRGCGGEFVLE